MKAIVLTILIPLTVFTSVSAQQFGSIERMDNVFRFYQQDTERGREDAETILQGYLTPMMKGIGFGMTSGWYHSAEVHKPGGFDFQISTSVSYIPDADQVFKVGALNEVEIVSPGDSLAPTIVGPRAAPIFRLKSTGDEFEGVGGLDLENTVGDAFIPVPMAQIGVGLVAGTDLKLRYVPNLRYSQYGLRVNMLGVGVTHNLTQYLAPLKDMGVEVSFFGGFTRFNFEADISQAKDGSQLGLIAVDAYTASAIASYSKSIFTVYAALGANRAALNLAFKGQFDTNGDPSEYEVVDPLDMKFDIYGHKLTIGGRLKVAAFTVFADYTHQRYNSVTGGVGFWIR